MSNLEDRVAYLECRLLQLVTIINTDEEFKHFGTLVLERRLRDEFEGTTKSNAMPETI